jgi:hypothetical protein
MAQDDRDQTFEKALARHLRSSAASGIDASALGAAPSMSCPDPETLAAYHDGLLSSEERNIWKQHVVSCDNCQLVLAHLETRLEIPVAPETDERTSPTDTAAAAKVRSLEAVNVGHAKRPPSLRWLWLVPAGAIAAGLIAFISLREPKPSPVASGSPVEVAENRQPSASLSSTQAAPAVPNEHKEKDQRADQPAGGVAGVVSSNHDAAGNELIKQAQSAQQSPYADAAKRASGPSLSRQKQEQQKQPGPRISMAAGGILDQKKFDAQTAPKLPLNGRLAAPPQAPPPQLSSQPSFLDGGTISAPAQEKAPPPAPASNLAVPKANVTNADAISASTETVEVTAEPQSRSQAKAMMRTAALQNPQVFVAPDGKHLWRVGLSGSLEHSSDKGLKWTLQTSGVNTDLMAGSAPSAKVCWVVGNAGTILRTTDGGAHWAKLDSPVTNDLTGVRAADAMHAWVWFVADKQTGLVKTYQTSDGGSSWFSVPSE